jgi:hypothetical protein
MLLMVVLLDVRDPESGAPSSIACHHDISR